MLETLKKKKQELHNDKEHLLDESYQHIVTLENIALNDNAISTLLHLDFLIDKMTERGDKEKTNKLEQMKSRMDTDKGIRAALRYGFGRVAEFGRAAFDKLVNNK